VLGEIPTLLGDFQNRARPCQSPTLTALVPDYRMWVGKGAKHLRETTLIRYAPKGPTMGPFAAQIRLELPQKGSVNVAESTGGIMPDPIDQRLADLPKLSKTALRELWKQLFKAPAFEANSNPTVSSIPSIRPGTRLVRQWGDQVHLVNVEANGYEYQGARYQSLSEIARVITGTHWSGPLFFGTKSEQTNSKSKEAR
jgi:hypothetical protein